MASAIWELSGEDELLDAYKQHTSKRDMPEWAVHMAKSPNRLVLPTIPFWVKNMKIRRLSS